MCPICVEQVSALKASLSSHSYDADMDDADATRAGRSASGSGNASGSNSAVAVRRLARAAPVVSSEGAPSPRPTVPSTSASGDAPGNGEKYSKTPSYNTGRHCDMESPH